MSHNAVPAFTKNGALASTSGGTAPGVAITAANTRSDGNGTIATDIFVAFTADATNGSWVESIRFMPTGTAPVTTTGTIGRIYVSSATSGAVTAATTTLIAEVLLTSIAADNASLPVNTIDMALGFRLPAGWTILVSTHAAPAATSGWKALVFGGDY